MENLKGKLVAARDWLTEAPQDPAPRIRWITTQIGILFIFFLTLWANGRESDAREDAFRAEAAEDIVVNCQQRVDAVNSLRTVILDIYAFIEERSGSSEDLVLLRERLDVVQPELRLSDCLSSYNLRGSNAD